MSELSRLRTELAETKEALKDLADESAKFSAALAADLRVSNRERDAAIAARDELAKQFDAIRKTLAYALSVQTPA